MTDPKPTQVLPMSRAARRAAERAGKGTSSQIPARPPEVMVKAQCSMCAGYLNSWRGIAPGREYDYKKDGLICDACDALPKPPPPPTRQQIMLANLDEYNAAAKAGEISVLEAFGLACQDRKAEITGEKVERFLRAELRRNPDGSIAYGPKSADPVDEHGDVIVGIQPEE